MDILGTFILQMNPWFYTVRKKRRLKRKIVTMVVVSLCLFQTSFAHDEQSKCESYESENCIQEVRFMIGKKSAEMRKSYTLSMFTVQGKEEQVAFFDYVGQEFYNCDPAIGYVCNQKNETDFFVTTPCAPSTKFSFFAEGEKAIPCMSKQTLFLPEEKLVPELKSDLSKPVDFQNDASRNSNQMKNKIVVAVCLGVTIPVATTAILYLLLKRRIVSTSFKKKRSKNVTEVPVVEQETSFLPKDRTYHTKMYYEDGQCTVQDDTTVIQELPKVYYEEKEGKLHILTKTHL